MKNTNVRICEVCGIDFNRLEHGFFCTNRDPKQADSKMLADAYWIVNTIAADQRLYFDCADRDKYDLCLQIKEQDPFQSV